MSFFAECHDVTMSRRHTPDLLKKYIRMENQNEQQKHDESVRELAAYLGLSEERIRTLLGSRVKGTAEFSQTGDFHFTPSKETGPRLERIKTTKNGSSLTKTLKDQPRLKMTLLSAPGSKDPEADLIEEANALLRTFKSAKKLQVKGRTISDGDVTIRADTATATLNVLISVPLESNCDYVTVLANKMGEVFKAVSVNRDKIKKLEPKS